jgi:hypothetical protein
MKPKEPSHVRITGIYGTASCYCCWHFRQCKCGLKVHRDFDAKGQSLRNWRPWTDDINILWVQFTAVAYQANIAFTPCGH